MTDTHASRWVRAALRLTAAAALLALAPAARAEVMPTPEQMVLPEEEALFSALVADVQSGGAEDSKAILRALDTALAKLPAPTKLRGFVQFSRAGPLIDLGRNADAIEAVEESIRLLPDYSGPLILAASAYIYSERPGVGADYLLRASHKDPEAVRALDDYEINNLLRRLDIKRDERRARALSDRLLEIGWTGTGLASRSNLAAKSIKRRLADGDAAGARALISKLLLPRHSRELLAANAYRAIWNDVEQWAGPRLERQWAIYLAEARDRWTASQSLDALSDYAAALAAANHDATIIRDILPLFARPLDKRKDYDLVHLANFVVEPLARAGRWTEVDAFYARAERTWPLGSDANALNFAANKAKWLLFRGAFRDGLRVMDAAIADARKWGPEVNADALATMHHYRACLLHELGRDGEAGVSVALAAAAMRPVGQAMTQLCMGRTDSARTLLIDALGDEQRRDDVILFVQNNDERPVPSAYWAKSQAQTDALRTDPALLAAIAKHGRILPFTLADGAPPERK